MPVGTTLAAENVDDLKLCHSMQVEEFEVLESIYPEYVSSQNLDGFMKLEIPIELGNPNSVTISEPASTLSPPPERKPTVSSISVATLPPLLLHIKLPASYPLHSPPSITSVRATHVWLPEIQRLRELLKEMWQAGEPVLYNWVEYIRTGEFLLKLGLLSSTNGDTISLSHPAPRIIAPLLTAYDKSSQSKQFAQNSYPCSVCLTSLKGSKCLRLLCDHIFCRSCLEDFWRLCIEEGNVSRVGCPDPECVKKGTEANEEDVARVVNEDELQRWKWLKEKRNIERDPTVVHCPVAVCQTPVSMPTDVDSESGWGRLRQCPRCNFSFCAFCKRTWHGPLSRCPIAQYEDLAKAYLDAEEGSHERNKLERRYGKANIRRLVAAYEEEKANMEWLKKSATMCPGCQCYVEKTLGCNHMTCWKCLQHFCYKCGQRLKADRPYTHYSQPGLPCYNQLFDNTDVAEEDWEIEW